MNTDISGVGVRVSFYLQTMFLSEHKQMEVLPYDFLSDLLFSLSLREIPRASWNNRSALHADRHDHGRGRLVSDFRIKVRAWN